MAMMAIGTALPGLTPGYATIGAWAPLILVICRLTQGFSTGGEWGGATIFMAEYATPGHRGFYTSWMQFGVALGFLAGSLSAWVLTSLLDAASLGSWGWRIPFLIGFLLLPIGYYLRRRVAETPIFERLAMERGVAKAPVRDAFTRQKYAMWTVCGTAIIWNAGGYVLLSYLPVFAAQVLKIDLSIGLAATSIGTLVRAGLTPLVGSLSDRIGRKPIVHDGEYRVLRAGVSDVLLAQDGSRLRLDAGCFFRRGRDDGDGRRRRAGDAVRAISDQRAFDLNRHRL